MNPDYDLVIDTYTQTRPRYQGVDFDKLTEPERVLFCTWQFVCEVNNGGFYQFFLNPSGEFAVETAEALDKIPMPAAAALLRRALAAFPNGTPAKDDDARYDQLEALPTKVREDLFDELTRTFSDSAEQPYALQAEYVRRNQKEFLGVSAKSAE